MSFDPEEAALATERAWAVLKDLDLEISYHAALHIAGEVAIHGGLSEEHFIDHAKQVYRLIVEGRREKSS